MKKKPPGLYANIQAKRARGEKMRKPGEEGAPSASDFKNAAKTAKKKKGVKREDPKGNPAGYYDKEGCKTCGGGKKPCKCSKKDMVGRKSGYADGYGKKCDAIAAEFNAVMDTAAREDKPCGASFIPQNAKCSKGAGQAKKSEKSKVGNIGARVKQGASAGSKVGAVLGTLGGAYLGAATGGVRGAFKGAAIGAAGGGAYGAYIGGSQGAGYAIGEKLGKRIQRNSRNTKSMLSGQGKLKGQYKMAYTKGKISGLSRKKMQELDMKYAMKFARNADKKRR